MSEAATMNARLRLMASLWLILVLTAVATRAQRPQIMHEKDEIVIPTGGLLNLTCRGEEPVAWLVDKPEIHFDTYEEVYEKGHGKPYVAYLVMTVNYTDVGYYMCFFNSSNPPAPGDIVPENPNVASIYLYVKDTQNLLTRDAYRIFHEAIVNVPFIVPCKPTFPEVEVRLVKNQGDFIRLENKREGFEIIPNYSLDHMMCNATYESFFVEKDVILQIKDAPVQKITRPTVEFLTGFWQLDRINVGDLEVFDVEEGQSFNITCHVVTKNHKSLHWEFPDQTNSTGNQLIFRHRSGTDMTRVLQVRDASQENTGNYTCYARANKARSRPSSIYVNVVGANKRYVELRTMSTNVTVTEFGEASMLVLVHAHPQPDFTWRKGETVLLETGTNLHKANNMYKKGRYSMEPMMEEGEIFVQISDPTVLDVGNYTLEATVDGGAATHVVSFNFIMDVKPLVNPVLYSPQKKMWQMQEYLKITCEASGHPKPQVRLQFKGCDDKTNCQEEFLSLDELRARGQPFNDLQEDKVVQKRQNELVTEKVDWTGRALKPGYFRCVASNDHGDDISDEVPFFVTDAKENGTLTLDVEVNGDFKKSESNLTIFKHDNVTFTCFGNRMLTSENLDWKVNSKKLTSGGPLGEKLNKTLKAWTSSYSHISEIDLVKAELSDSAMVLTCSDITNPEFSVTKRVSVKETVKPSWDRLTLEESYEREEKENLTLRCNANGIPKPTVTWYKDDKLIQEGDWNMRLLDSKIFFEFLHATDSGVYRCKVENRAGFIWGETTVSVTDPNRFNQVMLITAVIIAIVAMIVIIIFFCVRIYKDKKRAYDLRLEDHRMFVEGSPENLNPDLGLEQQADLLPYDTKYEVPREAIIFDKVLGSGAFGRVYRATAIGLHAGQPRTTVAVKMMKSRTDCAQLKALRSEVKIMIHIGRHINIVNLLGVCSKDFASKGELLLLVEYCRHGNILDYMRRHRKEFVDQINEHDRIDPSITDNRMRQRSGSGSRVRGSRGLKYAHLNFTPDAISFHVGQGSDGHSAQAIWTSAQDPMAINNDSLHRQSFRSRTMSGSSSHHHVASDMSTLTFESSNGGCEDYIVSNGMQGAPEAQFCSKTLLLWAFQIAKGMEYLAFKKVLHGDLAARNILLAEDNVVKISDFGLAKDIYKNENYRKKSNGPVPVKWLALECLRDGVFSTQSDIWAYGVVLWEIFSLGQNPYSGVEFDENFITKLEKGVRLEQPRFSTNDLYTVMDDCWNGNPLDRPTFSALEARLGEMIGEAEREYYMELNQPYLTENTDSTFLSRLQSPDYSMKVREGSPTVDKDGYEVPFSPSPCGAVALPFAVPQTPRHTTLQMSFLHDYDPVEDHAAGNYMAMSTPGHKDQTAFDFDDETVRRMTLQQQQQDSDFGEDEADGGLQEVKYLAMETPTKASPRKEEEEEDEDEEEKRLLRPSVSLQPKVSQTRKHDSGIYSPTTLQNNPSYVIMSSFMKTDENNYLTREDACDAKREQEDPLYLNYSSPKKPKEYLKSPLASDAEYMNLLKTEPRGRTVSEASSGVGSIAEESPTEFGRQFVREAIMEEPIAA